MWEGYIMDDLRYQVDLLTATNQKLKENERMYRLICDTSHRAFLYVDYTKNTVVKIGRWDAFDGFPEINEANDLLRILDAFCEDDQGELRRLLFIEKEGKTQQNLDLKLKDDRTWVNIEISVNFDETGLIHDKIFAFSDVTKQKLHQDELSYMAYYDHLTGLYNRNYFITKLKDFVEKASSENAVVSVLLIDIDDFHKISDSRGILTGDEIIQNLGFFIHDLCETNVIASRFDSDIFAMAIYDPCGHRSVDTIYRSVKEFLVNPIRLTDMTEVSISVSVGVAEYPESSDNPLQLINCAEIVMLKAKDAGKDNIKFFDTAILNNFLRDVDIENKLKEAVHGEHFYLNYQPQYYADSKKLRGVEALIRWRDKDGALISPAVFIPLSEKNGTIIPIGDFVLDTSIRTYMEWKKRFNFDMSLSINISSVQYNRTDFVPKVIAAINKYGMSPTDLELEVTESVLIDDFSLVISKMEELRDYGIKVSLDDFGTGFSSLSYLKGLPISTLKIDKSFIENITTDESSRVITETIISMSKKLGFETVAEGVETKEQLDYLNKVSCDLIQGFYLGKPLSVEEMEELLLRLI